jgi:hypothetical protein
MLSNLLSAKLAAAAAVAAFGIGTAAAATTGHLPGFSPPGHPAVTFVNASGTTTDPTSTTSSTSTSSTTTDPTTLSNTSSTPGIPLTGPANQHALFGLCTAFLAGSSDDGSTTTAPTNTPTAPSGKDDSTAFKALINETGGTPAATTAFCQNYVKTRHPGNPNDPSQSIDHGKPANAGDSSPGSADPSVPPSTTPDPQTTTSGAAHGNGPPANVPAHTNAGQSTH